MHFRVSERQFFFLLRIHFPVPRNVPFQSTHWIWILFNFCHEKAKYEQSKHSWVDCMRMSEQWRVNYNNCTSVSTTCVLVPNKTYRRRKLHALPHIHYCYGRRRRSVYIIIFYDFFFYPAHTKRMPHCSVRVSFACRRTVQSSKILCLCVAGWVQRLPLLLRAHE